MMELQTNDTARGLDGQWEKVDSRKRNRASPDKPIQQAKQTKINDYYWLNNNTSNRFRALSTEDDTNGKEPSETLNHQPSPPPPPIFVSGVKTIMPLIELLNIVAKDDHSIKILPNDRVKIQMKTLATYDKVTKALQEKNTEYFTYQMKTDRTFRVVLKNMHPSINLEDLKEEIQTKGHTVINIWNAKNRATKIPLPIFFIELKQEENNKEIYAIKYLLNMKVYFEAPHKKKEIPQCARCQSYGHTKKFCFKTPRCVKCAKNHLTSTCSRKEQTGDAKCALCDGNHPANYKGCTVYKQLQMKKFPPLREKLTRASEPKPGTTTLPIDPPPQPLASSDTYAQKVKTKPKSTAFVEDHSHPRGEPNGNNNSKADEASAITRMEGMMQTLLSNMNNMLTLITKLLNKLI
jgi:hypothetical protein